jgi:hypothetical protein
VVYRQVPSDSGLKAYTMRRAWPWRRLSLLWSYAQGSFGSAGKGTDLKGKRLFSPHRFFYKSILNVKGMTVISHRLCLVPINRWIVPSYCSRWRVLARASYLYFTFCQVEGTFVIQYCFYFSIVIKWEWIDNAIRLFVLSLIFHMFLLFLTYTAIMKVCPSWPSSEDHYIQREIML